MAQVRSRPFDLHLACEFLRIGRRATRERGETKNLSSGGALISIQADAEIGDQVEFRIMLIATAEVVVQIRCLGRVIRHDGVEVAVTIERYEFERWHEPQRKAG
jgi:PilZ domain